MRGKPSICWFFGMNWVNQADFARLCGVDRSTVNRWLKAGRIEADAQGRIDPEAAQRLRIATESPMPHHQARKAQFEEARAASGMADGSIAAPAGSQAASAQPSEPMPAAERIGTALRLETYKLQRAKAELAAMEIDRQAGALVERAEVEFVLADFGNCLRAVMESLPDRLSGELAAHQGNVTAIHKCLEDAAREVLNEIAGRITQKMRALA